MISICTNAYTQSSQIHTRFPSILSLWKRTYPVMAGKLGSLNTSGTKIVYTKSQNVTHVHEITVH